MASKATTLQDLLVEQLRDLLYAERQILKALPKMAKKTTSEDLKSAFEEHLQETEGQVDRLEQVFEELGLSARAKRCEAMDGIIDEAKSLMEEEAEPPALDAGLIAAAQKVEHYEIATYGTVATWAKQLGHGKVAQLLGETLEEEKQADEKLTTLAEGSINLEAQPGKVSAGAR
jgi:ferritin-like metal-binding protein YciE